MLDSKKLILKGFIYTSLGLVLSKLFTYGWRIIAARVGVEEYGMLSIVLAVMGFLIPISTLGLGSAVERYVSYYIGKDDRVGIRSTIMNSIKVSVFFSIFVAFCFFLLSDFIANSIFKNPDLSILLKLFSLFLPLFVLDQIISPLFRVYNRLEYLTFVKYILESLLKFILALLLIYLGYGIFGVIFAYFTSIGLSIILLFYFSRKHCFNFMDNTIVTKNNIGELLRYSLPLVVGGLSGFVLTATDTLMLGYFKDSVQVGIYNAAYPTANLLLLIPTGLFAVLLPIITKAFARKNFGDIKQTYIFVIKWIFVFNFFIFLVMFTFSDNIIVLLFGNDYLSGSGALKILAISIFLNSLFGSGAGILLYMLKKTKTIMNIVMAGAILNVLMNYYLIPVYGIVGGALATLMSTGIMIVLYQYYALCEFKIMPISKHMIYSTILNIIVFYCVMSFAHTLFGTISTVLGFMIISVMGIIYLYTLYIFKIINFKELDIVVNMLKQKS